MATSITDSSQLDRLLASGLPVIAKFSSKTCPPCVANAPTFDHAAQTHAKKCHLVVVDNQKCSPLFQRYGVSSMPTFVYFDNKGIEKKRSTGASTFSSDVVSHVNQYGKSVFDLSKGHALGAEITEKTTTATTTEKKDGATAAAPRRQPPTNPWADRNFNPKRTMEANEAQNKKQVEGKELVFGENGEAPAGTVCKDGVCRVVDSTSETEKKSKSVCHSNSCTIM